MSMSKRLLVAVLAMVAPTAFAATLTITLKNGQTITYQMNDVASIVYSGDGGAAPAASAAVASWSGTWKTTDVSIGRIALTQNGSSVTGTYHNGNSRITGNVNGNVFTGQWTESRSRKSGSMTLTIQPGGQTLKGSWSFSSSPNSKAEFTATRE